MPLLEEVIDLAGDSDGRDFTVISQRVELDFDFQRQVVTGSTQIEAQPLRSDLKAFRFNCRQCHVLRATIEGKPAPITYFDPYQKLDGRRGGSDVHHWDYLKAKIAAHVAESPDPELKLDLPTRLAVKELDTNVAFAFPKPPAPQRKDSEAMGPLDTPIAQAELETSRFAPMKIYIEFRVENFRDGLQWVGARDGDGRFPHVYTKNSLSCGTISSIFPCVDTPSDRCMWELWITCPKTLGDAFRKADADAQTGNITQTNGGTAVDISKTIPAKSQDNFAIHLNEEERALELTVIASGEATEEPKDDSDTGKRTYKFACIAPVTARHVGFAIGPFEQVGLSAEFRDADEEDKLGQNAIKVLGYCLPGRTEDLRNTCLPVTKAVDHMTVNYGSFPFSNYKLCFVDALAASTADTAGLSICSNRLMFPESVIDTLDSHTRTLIRAVAAQYFGVSILAKMSTDLWATTGIAGFMADMFMRKLAGNNEYRFRQKLAADKIFEQDIDRYSLHQLGGLLDIDPSEYDFMQLKASLVLFILDRRLTKQSGSAGMNRIITRVVFNTKTGDLQDGELSTEILLRICEKLGHAKLDAFFRQWVYNAGCPDFMVTQKFNKKKLVVEMTIQQMQSTRPRRTELKPSTFMREAKEYTAEAYATDLQPAFTGPMTIRIHEADGTPYEHIVEVRDVTTKFEIPYNTKYKRLKRSRKAQERSRAINGPEHVGENQDDVLLYCLGDTLQTEQEMKDWFLVDWTEAQDNQMGQESYEWIRMDADFEWIARMNLNMPIYMYVSQLQQDRDVVAQYESVQRIAAQEPHPMGATILIRTLMDKRYFHGIRSTAARGLRGLAVPSLRYLGLYHLDKAFSELYCYSDNPSMPRPNDFSDRASYIIQCTIPQVMAQIRDPEGRVPLSVRKFLFDKIKFNDNSHNENNENISDSFYLAILMEALIEAVVSISRPKSNYSFNFEDEEQPVQTEDDLFREEALAELERYRNSDEWTPSYANVTTVAAIAGIEKLVQSGVQEIRAKDLLTYTRSENAENVRISAFEAIVNLRLTQKPSIMRYFLTVMVEDPSPYIRNELVGLLGKALGYAAIGVEDKPAAQVDSMDVDSGLVLEREIPTDNRALEISRKSSPEGALVALRQAQNADAAFKDVFWRAIFSQQLTLQEINTLLDMAALIFEPSSMLGRLVLSVPLPKFWQAEHIGGGRIRFTRTKKARVRPSPHLTMSQKDFKLIAMNGLKYTGPVSRDVEKEAINDQIATIQKELERHQQSQLQQQSQAVPRINTSNNQMSPPPLPTPVEGGLKLSLKRKPSIDAGRASSPKSAKLAKIVHTPTVSTPSTPAASRPPKVNARPKVNTSTPLTTVPPKVKPASKRWSHIIKLSFPSRFSSVLEITSRTPVKRETSISSQTPSTASGPANDSYFPPQSGIIQSPQPTNGTFAAPFNPPAPTWNVGGFRNYSVSSETPASPQPIKPEPEETNGNGHILIPPESPDDMPLALQRREGSLPRSTNGSEVGETIKVDRPAAPTRKITLKFGAKRNSAGSPA